jgi:hypothetical protein
MKAIVFACVGSLVLGGIHYWMFLDPLYASLVTLLTGIGLWMGIREWLKNKKRQVMEGEMYYFLQSFLTTLAIKKTVHETYVDVYQRYQLSHQRWIQTYTSNDPLFALDNLKQRFQHPLYQIFYTTIQFYEQQGGEVMILFDSLFRQMRLVESRRLEIQLLHRRYFAQWVGLWILNGLVLVMSKIVLLDLFTEMLINPIFVWMLSTVYLYVPLSFYQWIQASQSHRGQSS